MEKTNAASLQQVHRATSSSIARVPVQFIHQFVRASSSTRPPSQASSVPQPMALVFVVLLALAAVLVPEAEAGHRRVYWAPPPPPPTPFFPTPDICDQCNCAIVPPVWPTPDMCDLCDRPIVPPGDFSVVPGFRGLSVSAAAGSAATAGSMSTTSAAAAAAECVTPLAGLRTACGMFLTRSDPETPAPQSECCAALVAFVNSSSSADDGTLRCMSPLILRHVNKLLDMPLDPARMMYLPMQCGVVFPPEVLYVCLTGQQRPPLVSRIPNGWEKPASVPAGH